MGTTVQCGVDVNADGHVLAAPKDAVDVRRGVIVGYPALWARLRMMIKDIK